MLSKVIRRCSFSKLNKFNESMLHSSSYSPYNPRINGLRSLNYFGRFGSSNPSKDKSINPEINEDVESIPKTSENSILNDLRSQMEDEAQKLKLERDEYKDKYQRSLAETENVRSRMQKQLDDARLYAVQGFCKDLLEVADVLGKATESVPPEVVASNLHLKGLYEGLTMTDTQLTRVFSRHGLERICPEQGAKFDPNRHEALFEQPVEGQASGTVAIVTKVGYVLHGRTIRPALVGVVKNAV